MKVFIEALGANEVAGLLKKLSYAATEGLHTLVDNADHADLIVLCGSWTMEGLSSLITANPLVKRYPSKCAVYSDDDAYLPLLPGVYCSPKNGFSVQKGRVQCYSYIVRHIQKGNPFVVPVAEQRSRDFLFSFQGATTSLVRKRLFTMNFHRNDVLIEDTTFHSNWVPAATRLKQQKLYVETIARSHFVLCPGGGGSGSFRLFEVMRMGVAPVLISDRYVLPAGPDWSSFLIRIPEKGIAKLPSILEPYRAESVIRGRRAKEAWDRWFSTEQEFNQIISRCRSTLADPSREQFYRMLWPIMILRHYAFRWARRNGRALVLWILRSLGLPPPYSIRDETPVIFDPKDASDDLG
jgi:hypothetical protein